MTELALTSLASPLLGDYVQPPRNRRAEQPAPESAGRREPPRETERVVTGEVLTASENTYSHLNNSANRFSSDSNTASGFTDQPRRFSLQSAMQTFRDNEAIVVDQNRAVQVSGIIDEYV
ncbi:MAG: hypothetical protein QG652_61 [Pseudomonadota bacterium]|nr:hypothetical protein [Pseudomonadota bacterium]